MIPACRALAALLVGLVAQAGAAQTALTGHGGPVKGLSRAGELILSASFDNSVGLWSLSGAHLRWLEGHAAAVNVAIGAGPGRLLSGGDDFDIIAWDTETGTALRHFTGHKGKVMGLALSPDGRRFASASWDGAVGLWDIDTGRLLGLEQAGSGAVNAVAFAGPDRLYSASADGTLRRWELGPEGLEPRRDVLRGGFGINVLVPGPGWLAYGTVDGHIGAIDLASEAPLAELALERTPVLALAATPSGALLAAGDGQGAITLVRTSDWTPLRAIPASGSGGPIWALAFLDETRLVAAGLAAHAVIWPVDGPAGPLFPGGAGPRFKVDAAGVSNGERQFARKCSVCHTLTPQDARRAGPSLHRIFGRKAGTLPGYGYSEALGSSDIIWSPETLDRLFDLGPEHYTPGSKMPMQRITRAQDRTDLIDYLRDATR
ncbi:c-type cytochrome [Paroceanicella profunda]|uniref:C-type cytochrome n=1 Tax=Paroceanicella profunda TaxID=2579971 RepID=A0A5B8FHH8_9RHOB|nr:c-type cytochrome [Paroceanicella profunda]QDL92431.1 c-type cytochrome [Paroceanicella profunda]